jgi:hypothetical protein
MTPLTRGTAQVTVGAMVRFAEELEVLMNTDGL